MSSQCERSNSLLWRWEIFFKNFYVRVVKFKMENYVETSFRRNMWIKDLDDSEASLLVLMNYSSLTLSESTGKLFTLFWHM